MINQNGVASRQHHTTEETPTAPLLQLRGTGNGRDLAGAGSGETGTGTDEDVEENGAGPLAKTKTVTIVDTNQNQTNNNKPEDRVKVRRKPLGAATAPDGGWGWVVVMSSFTISVLVDGVCFSFGVFFQEFRSEFQTSKAITSWIGSVLNGTYLVIGPVVSALVNVYGCKKVVMAGAVLSSFALFISTFSETVEVVILTWGFLTGFGFGLMYLPAIVMVGYYFERRRALATGIACCGSGIGAICFAPLCEFLIVDYGWRGATWILSGLVLNGLVCSLLYKPLEPQRASFTDVDATNSSTSMLPETETAAAVNSYSLSAASRGAATAAVAADDGNALSVAPSRVAQAQPSPVTDKLVRHTDLAINHPQTLRPLAARRRRSTTLDEPGLNEEVLRLSKSMDLSHLSRPHQAKPARYSKDGVHNGAKFGSARDITMDVLSPLQRKDIFYSGSLLHLKEYKELATDDANHERPGATDMNSNHSLVSYDYSVITTNPSSTKSFSAAISSVFDFSLLKSPTFIIYGCSAFFCMAGFFVPFVYLPPHAMDLGFSSKDGAYLISVIGITNTVGRVVVGFISDQPWADALIINNVALIIGGTATAFMPYYPTFFLLATYSSVFGLSVAVFVSLRSIIMVDLMGLDKLTSAFGLVIMFQGISSFLGAPVAGALSDMLGDYNAAFYLAGLSLILSGIICLPLRRISRWESERAKQRALARLAAEVASGMSGDLSEPSTSGVVVGEEESIDLGESGVSGISRVGHGQGRDKKRTQKSFCKVQGAAAAAAVERPGSADDADALSSGVGKR